MTTKAFFDSYFKELSKTIVGQESMLKYLMIGIMTDSNVLMEGYPGLAKTRAIRSMAEAMELKFSRIQGTPDLMPSDITGTYLIEETKEGKRKFRFEPGPLFANIVLADEINRATPKTQSALLEAMQEKQVTVGNETFKLEAPFFILATQNPIEQEGTYPLPEAQADRFLLKITVDYPDLEQEIAIVDMITEGGKSEKIKPLLNAKKVIEMQETTYKVPIANDIKRYAVSLVSSTRKNKELIEFGASPRASIGLILAAKANALVDGRKHVSKEDIKEMALPILRHRIILSFEAQRQNMTTDDVIRSLLK